jgi:hypothetical protein
MTTQLSGGPKSAKHSGPTATPFPWSRVLDRLRSAHPDFWLLVVIAWLTHIPAMNPAIWPDNDTLMSFQIFYGFYTDFFFHHELARWLPWASYGIPLDYWQLNYMTPSMFFSGLIGALFHVKNVLLVFKSAVLLEHLVLLTGTYLLSRLSFRSRLTVFFVCLGIISSSVWLFQINFNLRLFYLLPLIFYFLLVFFRQKQSSAFWTAALVFVIAQMGVPPYYVILHLLILGLFFSVIAAKNSGTLTLLLRPGKKNLLGFSLFMLMTFVYLGFAAHMLDFLQSIRAGVSNESNVITLSHFLSWCPGYPLIGMDKFLGLFYGEHKNLACSIYVGILPLIFLLYALLKVRRPLFNIFGLLTLFLFLLSVGDASVVARWAYFLYPPFHFFRYIGNLSGILRLFLMILAGFGLDHFLMQLRPPNHATAAGQQSRKVFLFCGLSILAIMFYLGRIPVNEQLFLKERSGFYVFAFTVAAVAVPLLTFQKLNAKRAGLAIAFLFALDILAFQQSFFVAWYSKLPSFGPMVQNVYDFKFQSSRLESKDLQGTNPRAGAVLQFFKTGKYQLHHEAQSLALFDTPFPTYPSSKTVRRVSDFTTFCQNNRLSNLLLAANGSSQPKLRLSSRPMFARNRPEAFVLLKGLKDAGSWIVLENVPEELQKKWQVPLSKAETGRIDVCRFSFNRLDLTVDVSNPGGAWLYYADAYHPGWNAAVDRRPASIYPANTAFKAIFVETGRHSVSFQFDKGLQNFRAHLLVIAMILFVAALAVIVIRTMIFSAAENYQARR